MAKPGSPPAAPNPVTVANAQAGSNVQTAQAQAALNDVSTYSPYGSTTFTPGTPQTIPGTGGAPNQTVTPYNENINLSPAEQQILQQQQGLTYGLGTVGQNLMGQIPSGPLNFSGLPQVGTPGQINTQAANAAQQLGETYLAPQQAEQTKEFQDQMQAQGFTANDQGYQTKDQLLQNSQQQAQQANANQAILTGAQVGGQTFNEQLAGQQQAAGLQQTQYQEPLSQLAQVLSATQGVASPSPSTATPTSVAPTNVTGAYGLAQQGQQYNYGQQVANTSSMNAGLGSLAGLAALGLLSSRAFKVPEATADPGAVLDALRELPIQTWHYRGSMGLGADSHIGPYAEDFRAAFGIGDGRTINLVDALGVCLVAIKALTAKVEALEGRK